MKKIFLLITAISIFTLSLNAQNCQQEREFIEVTGIHKYMAMPDSIVVNVVLTDNSSVSRSDIAEQEKKMVSAIRNIGVDVNKSIRLVNYSTNSAKRNNMNAYKSFNVILDNADQVNSLFIALNNNKITNVSVSYTGLKNFEELLLKARVEAVKNAKKQALAMVEGVGRKLHAVPISIFAVDNHLYPRLFSSSRSQVNVSSEAESSIAQEFDISFKEIKVEAKVNAKFHIM